MTVIYLDVDGSLMPTRLRPESEFTDWTTEFDGTQWSPSMIARLGALPAERVWLTTWLETANMILCPRWGWDDLTCLDRRGEALWWKFEALVRHHRRGVPFVWVDDELHSRLADNPALARRLDALASAHLLISPDPRRGLTGTELTSIEAFVTACAH